MNQNILLTVFFDLLKGQKKPIQDWSMFQLESFIFAIAVAIVGLIIIWIISDRIPYQRGSTPKDALLRRIFFFLLGFLSFFILFYLLIFVVQSNVLRASQNQLYRIFVSSLVIEAATYFVLGFILTKIFKFNKFGTIFPGSKK